jgi:predicted nucleic acid-binding protein
LIYVDTGCLVKLYFPEPDSARVAALVAGQPITYLGLHELELWNALSLKRFRREATLAQLRAVESLMDADLRGGVLYRAVVDWEQVLREALALATAHTRRIGCRTIDILHCAAASLIGPSAFVTTDRRQRLLARAVGFVCPQV